MKFFENIASKCQPIISALQKPVLGSKKWREGKAAKRRLSVLAGLGFFGLAFGVGVHNNRVAAGSNAMLMPEAAPFAAQAEEALKDSPLRLTQSLHGKEIQLMLQDRNGDKPAMRIGDMGRDGFIYLWTDHDALSTAYINSKSNVEDFVTYGVTDLVQRKIFGQESANPDHYYWLGAATAFNQLKHATTQEEFKAVRQELRDYMQGDLYTLPPTYSSPKP